MRRSVGAFHCECREHRCRRPRLARVQVPGIPTPPSDDNIMRDPGQHNTQEQEVKMANTGCSGTSWGWGWGLQLDPSPHPSGGNRNNVAVRL